jgi:tetratricopeptide (TPR) repeat protein
LDQDADYFVNIGAYKEAMVIIDSLISIGFERDFEYTKKALVYLLQDDFISCEEFADSALMLSNQSALAHDLKGLSQLKRGKFTESISSFSEAIGIDPSFSVAYLNRAMAHLRIGNNDAAMADL